MESEQCEISMETQHTFVYVLEQILENVQCTTDLKVQVTLKFVQQW